MKNQSMQTANNKMTTIPLEFSRLIMCESSQHQVVFLKEKNGTREFPIVIGYFEAAVLDRKLRKQPTTRPLTHDLLCRIVELLQGEILDVLINRVERQNYFAQIRVRQGERIIAIDARPSDALAVSLCSNPPLPILTTQDVLEESLRRDF